MRCDENMNDGLTGLMSNSASKNGSAYGTHMQRNCKNEADSLTLISRPCLLP